MISNRLTRPGEKNAKTHLAAQNVQSLDMPQRRQADGLIRKSKILSSLDVLAGEYSIGLWNARERAGQGGVSWREFVFVVWVRCAFF